MSINVPPKPEISINFKLKTKCIWKKWDYVPFLWGNYRQCRIL